MPFEIEPAPLAPEPIAPTFGELIGAAFTRENIIGSTIEAARQPGMAPLDTTFDPFTDIAGYEDDASSFIPANSPEDVHNIKLRIDRERARLRTLAEGGALGIVAQLGAGVLDPTMLLPIGGQVWAATRFGRVALSAARTAGAVGAGQAVQEAGLQATQLTRPLAESAINIGAATVLGGVLGGTVSAYTSRQLNELATRSLRESAIFERELAQTVPEASTAGAAATRTTTLEQETFASALLADRALARTSPNLRTGTSPSVETRRVAQELVDQPLDYRKNLEGVPTPVSVERRALMAQGSLADAMVELNEAFVRYRRGPEPGMFPKTRIATSDLVRTPAKMTSNQFAEAVAHAMRRGDASAIPEVEAAARAMRARVFDPLAARAIETGLLDPAALKVTTAPSYLMRVYDTPKISKNRPAFERIVRDWLAAAPETAKLDPAEIRDLAETITSGILSTPAGRTSYAPVPLARGPARERTFNIPDHLIEEYLENDIRRIASAYTRTMAADAELTAAFGRADMQPALDRITAHYNQLRAGKSASEAARLTRREARDIKDIEAMRDRVRGTHGLPADPNGLLNRAYLVARDLNYLRLLGGMTLGALSDMGSIVMKEGLARTVGSGLVPMLTEWRTFRLATGEARLAGNALDMVLDSRAMSLADVLDDSGRWTRFERGVAGLTSTFGVATLMAPWNTALKQFAAVVAQTRSLQAIERGAMGAERTRLASLGIGPDEAARIAEQFALYGRKEGPVWWANTAEWTDRVARDSYRAALSKEIDSIIVTPGAGDRPLWMTSSTVGKMIGQFRSFSMASSQRVMLSGLQHRDMATLNGVIMMTALGMLSHAVRESINRDAKPLPDANTAAGMAQWVRAGLERSGLTGWLFDVNNIAEKVTQGRIGVSGLIGGQPISKNAARSITHTILGPTAGLGEEAVQVLGAATPGVPWTASDTSAVRQMLPYNNIFYLRQMFDAAEDGINRAAGVAPKPRPGLP